MAKISKLFTLILVTSIMVAPAFAQNTDANTTAAAATQWPVVTRQMRPWTRWWWLGSAVDQPNLTRLLETYHQAGLGGVEITPIYGVQGQEQRDIPYLSPRWVEMLRYTINEAHRLDMGVDMPTGTGWPFGGPHVSSKEAEDKLVIETIPLTIGQDFVWSVTKPRPQALAAVGEQGQTVQLLDKLDGAGRLGWTPPPGQWTLYAVTQKWAGQNVKRAAPGGQGKVINPFSQQALTHYLQWFDEGLKELPLGALRCHFHDSFEYRADWTAALFGEFQQRRGYDLRDHLPSLASTANAADAEETARVRTDYRETIADLLLEHFTRTWTNWAHSKGSLSRNQAHGSPGNLLDLYGTVDIPETEVFRHVGDPRISKFASSAAHVMGHPLTSSESCTWMSEHFTETLGQAKTVLDRLFVAGINHIFYHGTAYSPADAPWPGWLFYASTHFEPNNPIWHDFPALNSYVTRCQSVLQAGQPDNDILLYWPLHDAWQKHPKLFQLTIDGDWLANEPIGQTAQHLWERGFTYDYISDHQLQLAKSTHKDIQLPGGHYRAIVVPPCTYMPLDSLQALLHLAHSGATVIFQEHLPVAVPGLGHLTERQREFDGLLNELKLTTTKTPGIQSARLGKGHVYIGSALDSVLALTSVRRESMADHPGLMFIRRAIADGQYYFVTNQGETALEGWVDLATKAKSVLLMNPMTGQTGIAAKSQHKTDSKVYLQLQPGESIIIKVSATHKMQAASWPYFAAAGEPITLQGNWKVRFLEGGPQLPPPFETPRLASWTELGDAEAKRFAGTARYALTFDAPPSAGLMQLGQAWRLDLGKVCASARVRLNGQELGTLIAAPFGVQLNSLKPTGNLLEIDVTNVAANRIRDMDQRQVPWKIFREINFVNIDYKPFDASNWPLFDAGLLGPVRLTPLKPVGFN